MLSIEDKAPVPAGKDGALLPHEARCCRRRESRLPELTTSRTKRRICCTTSEERRLSLASYPGVRW